MTNKILTKLSEICLRNYVTFLYTKNEYYHPKHYVLVKRKSSAYIFHKGFNIIISIEWTDEENQEICQNFGIYQRGFEIIIETMSEKWDVKENVNL